LRDFEVPMSGGFYLTRYTPELEDYFAVGLEVECYRDISELIDKSRYYLAHSNERERIRLAGHLRSKTSHTWEHRFAKLFGSETMKALLPNARS
jgi:spore maturation protein CgeB